MLSLFFSFSFNVESYMFYFPIGFFAQRKINCASCVVGVERGWGIGRKGKRERGGWGTVRKHKINQQLTVMKI